MLLVGGTYIRKVPLASSTTCVLYSPSVLPGKSASPVRFITGPPMWPSGYSNLVHGPSGCGAVASPVLSPPDQL